MTPLCNLFNGYCTREVLFNIIKYQFQLIHLIIRQVYRHICMGVKMCIKLKKEIKKTCTDFQPVPVREILAYIISFINIMN